MENIIPKVSVIIPVYKAAQYIEKCCRSLFEQTLDDMEFIFVDDCSPDSSMQIIQQVAEEYPARQSQIKILSHSPNRGVSYTRQQGMDEAKGEFIIHCDSDDWIDPNMYETMYNVAREECADVVCCGFVTEYPDGRKTSSTFAQKKLCSKVVFNLAPQTGSLCSKIVRLSMLREAGVHFPPDINWGEDFCVSIAGLVLSQKTIQLPEAFYHYRQNEESITHTITMKQCDQLIACAPYVESFLRRIGKYEEYEFQVNYLKFQVKQFLLIYRSLRDYDKWAMTYPECHKDLMKYDSSLYLRVAGKCIACGCVPIANILLSLRDCLLY